MVGIDGKDHPITSYIPHFVPRTNLLDYSYIFKIWTQHGPTSLQVQRPPPKGKKMRMDHPCILGFCQNVTFDLVFSMIFPLLGENPLS